MDLPDRNNAANINNAECVTDVDKGTVQVRRGGIGSGFGAMPATDSILNSKGASAARRAFLAQ